MMTTTPVFQRRLCWPFHEFAPDFGEEEIAAMARLGFNQAVITFDSWAPCAPQLFQMVDCEVWPGMGDPEILAWSREWLSEQVALCRRHYIEPYIYLFEPLIPFEQFSVYAPQSVREAYRPHIEEECLGWRIVNAGQFMTKGRPLCFSHPKVRQFYKSLTRELVKMLPGLRGFFVTTGDGRLEFCDHHCPACRVEGDVDAVNYQMRGLITMLDCLHEGASEVRPDFEIVLDNHAMLLRALEVAEKVHFPLVLASKDTGGDCDMAPSEICPAFRAFAERQRSTSQPWYAISEVCSAEEYGLIFGYPDPLTIIRKVKAIAAEGSPGLATYWGVAPQAQTVNDRTLALVMANPGVPEEKALRAVTEDVFGEESTSAWMRVWRAIRAATEVWMKRRGYHSLRQNFFAARFKLFAWPVTFPLTSPEGVPEYSWQWEMCFRSQPDIRKANLMMMPELIDHLDCAIALAEKAGAATPAGRFPLSQHYTPHEAWESRRYAREVVDALRSVREIVECEMLTYRVAEVREMVEDLSIPASERRARALATLPVLFDAHARNLEHMIEPLERQLVHLRFPRRPSPDGFRSEGNTEKEPSRWEFIPLLHAKQKDIPDAKLRANEWVFAHTEDL